MQRREGKEYLEAWVNDAINSDATSKEVYESLVDTIREEIDYHRRCLTRSEQLLIMVKGNLSALSDPWHPAKDGETFEETLDRDGYEYTPTPNTNKPNIPSRD